MRLSPRVSTCLVYVRPSLLLARSGCGSDHHHDEEDRHHDNDNVDNGYLWKKNIMNKSNSWGKTERLWGFVNLGGLWGIRAKCDSKLKTAAGPQVRPPCSRKTVILGGFNQKIVPSGELIFGRHDCCDLIIMDFPV